MVNWIGGGARTCKSYDFLLRVMLRVKVMNLYGRWIKSERFPPAYGPEVLAGRWSD